MIIKYKRQWDYWQKGDTEKGKRDTEGQIDRETYRWTICDGKG